MTTNYNNFKINKMMVFQNKFCALEISFLEGLNVIYGKNSAGKSSLLDTLVHSLGGEDIDLNPIVEECSYVLTEIEIEKNKITLSRELSNKRKLPISIFYGNIEEAILSEASLWHTFPYSSYNEKFGFSKIFFDFLNYPETVSTETTITTHQVLRILYADQANNHLPIFRHEQWDNAEKRLAIRDYIFGLFSGELYEQQLFKKSTTKQLDDAINKLQSIFKVLGRSSEQMIEDFIIEEKNILDKNKEILLDKIFSLTNKNDDIELASDQQDIQNRIQIELTQLNKAVLSLESQLSNQEIEILDLESFYKELTIRMSELNNSIASNSLITNIVFDFCPCCHSKIEIETDENICKLCKSHVSEDINHSNLLQLKTELNFQIQETNKLVNDEKKNYLRTVKSLNEQKLLFSQKKQEFDLLTNRWHTSYELELFQSYKELGEIDSELKNIEKRLEIAKEIKSLEERRNHLQETLNSIVRTIERMTNDAKHKLTRILNNLNLNLKNLLAKDIGIQEEFLDPNNKVEVVFEDNRIMVNGTSHFSQSSTIVLRHLFHLALLQLADQDDNIRVPHFFVLDGINDGGLENDRAENLQKIIFETCQNLTKPFQLICATSELFPVLESANRIEYLNGTRTFKNKLIGKSNS